MSALIRIAKEIEKNKPEKMNQLDRWKALVTRNKRLIDALHYTITASVFVLPRSMPYYSVIAEGIYACGRLLQYCTDLITATSVPQLSSIRFYIQQVAKFLTQIEVMIERCAQVFFKSKYYESTILSIESIKALCRLYLLFSSTSPTIAINWFDMDDEKTRESHTLTNYEESYFRVASDMANIMKNNKKFRDVFGEQTWRNRSHERMTIPAGTFPVQFVGRRSGVLLNQYVNTSIHRSVATSDCETSMESEGSEVSVETLPSHVRSPSNNMNSNVLQFREDEEDLSPVVSEDNNSAHKPLSWNNGLKVTLRHLLETCKTFVKSSRSIDSICKSHVVMASEVVYIMRPVVHSALLCAAQQLTWNNNNNNTHINTSSERNTSTVLHENTANTGIANNGATANVNNNNESTDTEINAYIQRQDSHEFVVYKAIALIISFILELISIQMLSNVLNALKSKAIQRVSNSMDIQGPSTNYRYFEFMELLQKSVDKRAQTGLIHDFDKELRRRRNALFYYLIRAPVFDRATLPAIKKIIQFTSKLPFVPSLLEQFVSILQYFNNTHFYNAASS